MMDDCIANVVHIDAFYYIWFGSCVSGSHRASGLLLSM